MAWTFSIETLRSAEAGTITLCALGPLTNIAMALVKAPEVAGKIRELVVMGGACFELGNVTPAAEFNMHVDPHAAAIVVDSGIPITMIPLDVTHQLVSTPSRLAALRALGNRCGPAVAGLLTSFEKNRRAKFGSRARALHDPAVIAISAAPGPVSGSRCQCRDRDAEPTDDRNDGGGLVGRHRQKAQCAVHEQRSMPTAFTIC